MTLNRPFFLITLGFLAISSLFLSLFEGSISINLQKLISVIKYHDDPMMNEIIFSIRLPRTCCAFVTGGLLALSGALMQTLLRNPLADPYVLGTSSGAAVMILICILCGITGIGLSIGAWTGSLISIALVFMLAARKKHWHAEHLLLIGIALASGFSAIISLLLLTSPDHAIRSMLFWLVGDLSEARLPVFEFGILVIGLIISLLLARKLNILVRGENVAAALGISIHPLKIQLFLLSSLLTATAVTLSGCIGFIGLITPHLFRLVCGYDHRFLLPGCVLLGGSLLTIADTIARTIISPMQLPVGIVMVLIGIPIFLFLLQKK